MLNSKSSRLFLLALAASTAPLNAFADKGCVDLLRKHPGALDAADPSETYSCGGACVYRDDSSKPYWNIHVAPFKSDEASYAFEGELSRSGWITGDRETWTSRGTSSFSWEHGLSTTGSKVTGKWVYHFRFSPSLGRLEATVNTSKSVDFHLYPGNGAFVPVPFSSKPLFAFDGCEKIAPSTSATAAHGLRLSDRLSLLRKGKETALFLVDKNGKIVYVARVDEKALTVDLVDASGAGSTREAITAELVDSLVPLDTSEGESLTRVIKSPRSLFPLIRSEVPVQFACLDEAALRDGARPGDDLTYSVSFVPTPSQESNGVWRKYGHFTRSRDEAIGDLYFEGESARLWYNRSVLPIAMVPAAEMEASYGAKSDALILGSRLCFKASSR